MPRLSEFYGIAIYMYFADHNPPPLPRHLRRARSVDPNRRRHSDWRPIAEDGCPLARVTAVEHLGGPTLRVTFSDGLVRELDFAGALPGALAAIDDEVFATVEVDPVARTVSWLDGVDLDPDVLHGDNEAARSPRPRPRVVREYRLQHTR